jgi:type III pantothenate kinase
MNLIFDSGNSRLKVALMLQDSCIEFIACDSFEEWKKLNWHLKHPITNAIIASVTGNEDDINNYLTFLGINCIVFTNTLLLPIANLYKSASTLGSDRLAAAVGGYALYPNQNTLTIDVGTCIKYNFTNSHNQYLGGAISPGVRLRYQSMHDYTAKLPLLTFNANYNLLIGTTTQESIVSGVQLGIATEIDGSISNYLQQYAQLNVVLTGGDHSYFVNHLKNKIFADELLLIKGLNLILNYNKPHHS